MSLFNFHVCFLFVFLTCARLQPSPSRPYVTSVKPRLFPEQAVDTYTDTYTHTHKCTHAHTHSSALEQILTDFKSQKQSVPAPDISLPRVSISEKERNSRISLLTKQGSLSTYGTLPYKVPPAHREQIHISGQSDTQPRSRPLQGLEQPSSLLSHRRPNVPQGMMGHKLMPSRQWAGVTWEEVNL